MALGVFLGFVFVYAIIALIFSPGFRIFVMSTIGVLGFIVSLFILYHLV
jgi:hypothetical protein